MLTLHSVDGVNIDNWTYNELEQLVYDFMLLQQKLAYEQPAE